VWNIAADLTLSDEAAFGEFIAKMMAGVRGGRLPDFEAEYLGGLSGHDLVAAWITQYRAMTARFAAADPKARVKWVGPDMSVLSSITARLMETWSHAQAIYDVLGVERVDADRIGNIVRLGVNTYGFTWKNQRMEPPGPMPQLKLTAPSAVVTQCRNIADTSLDVSGEVAHQWMAVAQCFAGPPQDPPAPGTRFRRGV
jgi:uncharacterized protein (TIGR03084 family)